MNTNSVLANTNNKSLIKVCRGDVLSPPPMWLMRQAGRYLPEYRQLRKQAKNFMDFCYTPELASEATLQPLRRFAFDASIIFSDILVIPDALGVQVSFEEGKGPLLNAIDNPKRVSGLNYNEATLVPVYEAIKLVRAKLDPSVSLIGFAGAPWTLATYMVEGKSTKDFSVVKAFAYRYPNEFKALLNTLVHAVSTHLIAQVKAGAEVLQIFDSWAGAVPEDYFDAWVIQPTRQIVSNLKTHYPNIPIIGFPKHVGVFYKAYAEQTGVDAISCDYHLPLDWITGNISLPVQGVLDPALLVASKELSIARAKKIVNAFKGRPFIFNLGHGILPTTPIEHVEALIEAVKGRV